MKSIILIQHCQSEHHVNGLTGGWTDTPLTRLGRKQAKAIGVRLAAELLPKVGTLYTSDLLRTAQTAEAIARHAGIEPALCPELREINIGEGTWKTVEWLRQNQSPIPPAEQRNFIDHRMLPGAETKREFFARTAGFLERLEGQEERVILVTHGGVVMNVIYWWLRLPVKAMNNSYVRCSPGSISYLEEDALGYRSIKALNDTRHLDGLKREGRV